ncbi:protein kinase [Priestia sp. FSL P4-0332]|uniref:protein kinase domain-containing protein n=1 Tax=Priestia sp. FSL P4-0332 TaxID=2921634 RepID=UPI0030F95DC9
MTIVTDPGLIFLNNKRNDYRENHKSEIIKRYLGFYVESYPKALSEILSLFHYQFNHLLKYMNGRMESGYYTAEESRSLIYWIEELKTLESNLKDTKYEFETDPYYAYILEECDEFLQYYRGSTIPEHITKINIIENAPIFKNKNSNSVTKANKRTSFSLKSVGRGSYATVHKYKDDFYNRTFAVKKADKNLTEEEYKRFKIEFEEMKKLNSPYVIEVYNFDEENRQYIMEYASETLDQYISKNNNNLEVSERINLVKQILRAFIYINSKNVLHRDISTTNILIKRYEELKVIKVSDFGLVKRENSSLTNINTKMKGSLNDRKLELVGFNNYKIWHETYALTRLIYFVMTGKSKIGKFKNDGFKNFIETGIADNEEERYQSVKEMQEAFNKIVYTFY